MRSTAAQPSILLTRLRAETRTEHEAIEAVLGLMDNRLSRERYQFVLERFYGFYRPLEPAIGDVGGWSGRGLDLDARRKSPWLEADLRALGCNRTKLDLCTDLPPHDTPAECFGCMYVLEGSTLGGQIISRHVREVLGVTPEAGGRFYDGYSDRTGEMWQSFRSALTRFVVSSDDHDVAIHAAKETFQKLNRWIAARGQSR